MRKLSVGVASVLLSTTVYLGVSQGRILADTQIGQNSSVAVGETTTVPSQSLQTQKISINANSSNNNQSSSSAQALSAQQYKAEAAKQDVNQAESANVQVTLPDSANVNANGQKVMAKNNTVLVKVTYHNDLLDAGQPITVAVSDPSWQVYGWPKDEKRSLGTSFESVNNGDGTFTVTPTSKRDTSADFTLGFTLQYGKNVSANTPVDLTITTKRGNQTVGTPTTVRPIIIPYTDKVQSDEIAHGWASKETKSVNKNDDSLHDILKGTAATKPGANRLAMQYMVEWNYGKVGTSGSTILAPLETANFTAHFSEGQTLLPDTIKVFRVYKQDAVNNDGSRKDINDTYKDIAKYENGQWLYEDTAFEQYLKDHLTVTTTNNGTTKNLSWKDYQKALQAAKDKGTEPPLVNGIHFDERDMAHVHVSTDPAGTTHDFAHNAGDNTDKTIATPHSTFFIQMDTLLDGNMPVAWTKPGQGPSIVYNPASGDFNGIGTKKASSASPVFLNGGNGFTHDIEYAATLHFADVTDKYHIVSLDSGHGVSPLDGDDESNAKSTTKITFNDAQDEVTKLTNAGYVFVGASHGTKTSGKYVSSDLYDVSSTHKYNGDKYGTYGDSAYNEHNNDKYAYVHSFTLNFIHDTTQTSEKKTISEHIEYVDEKTGKPIYDSYTSKTPLTFTRDVTTDAVTKVKTYSTWKIAGNLPAVPNPTIKDYAIDPAKITEKLNGHDETYAKTGADEIGAIAFNQSQIEGLPNGGLIQIVVPYTKKDPKPSQDNFHAKVHFAAVDKKNNKVEKILDNNVQAPDGISTVTGHSTNDPITFAHGTVEDAIQKLQDEGYKLVGISKGNKTVANSVYDGSSYYPHDDYKAFVQHNGYGNYIANATPEFTLNFIHGTNQTTEKKTVSENIKYVEEGINAELHPEYNSPTVILQNSYS